MKNEENNLLFKADVSKIDIKNDVSSISKNSKKAQMKNTIEPSVKFMMTQHSYDEPLNKSKVDSVRTSIDQKNLIAIKNEKLSHISHNQSMDFYFGDIGDQTKMAIDDYHMNKSQIFHEVPDISLLIPNTQLEPIDFDNLTNKTSLERVKKVSEFIVVSLAKHFDMHPEKIVRFLVEKSKL